MRSQHIRTALEAARDIYLPDVMPVSRLASALGLPEAEILTAIESGEIVGAKQIAGHWYISKRALLESFDRQDNPTLRCQKGGARRD